MKVGTDGVLLGAWVSVDSCKLILDVGTGTGLIALMLAQRSNACIDAIDVDKDACLQAESNISASPFTGRINVFHKPFEDFIQTAPHTYDLIVSNPPYFVKSLQSPNDKRNTARHTQTFSFIDLIEKGRHLLTANGRIAFIIPYEQTDEVINLAKEKEMFIVKRTNVSPTPNSTPKRLLIELSANPSSPYLQDNLIIEESRHQYTPEFLQLTNGFYL